MSDFSIDYILNRAGDKYLGTNASIGVMQRLQLNACHQSFADAVSRANAMTSDNFSASTIDVHILQQPFDPRPMFDWLQYTRYHPPKLPRALRQVPTKRTPGRLPRIPFTPVQLQTLETAYQKSNYLSAEDANNLATSLHLTNTRVKIWFQNRRARERREKRERDEDMCDSTLSSNASSPEPEIIVTY